MVHALYVLLAALPLHCAPQSDTVSTDPFTTAKWKMFKRETSEGHLAYVRGNVALRDLKDRERFPYRAGGSFCHVNSRIVAKRGWQTPQTC